MLWEINRAAFLGEAACLVPLFRLILSLVTPRSQMAFGSRRDSSVAVELSLGLLAGCPRPRLSRAFTMSVDVLAFRSWTGAVCVFLPPRDFGLLDRRSTPLRS